MVFLRLSFGEAYRFNAERGPEVCKHNSGAARKYDGKPIPCPKTFVQPQDAEFKKGEVEEVVFRGLVSCPPRQKCALALEGTMASTFPRGS